MIKSFKNQGTQDIFNGIFTKEARQICPANLWDIAARKLDILDSAVAINDLRAPPGNRLEKLKGDRIGQHSIRINDQYRICFTWLGNPQEVEITDYHK
jgi:proteic killer suppression protein